MISTEEIKALRKETGLSIVDCRKALEDAFGDKDQAIRLLKQKGHEVAAKKAKRNLGAGLVDSYVHTGETVGVLLELLCETDFVAKNAAFKSVAHDIAMHIAAMSPSSMVELLEQPFVKDSSQKISDLVSNAVQKFGERIEVGRFARFSLN